MRPIRLKISGLNSYIETQTIDFEKLTERGLFGIFGPTGCGKSTILDAIILSLYGHNRQKGIPRSTNEFINTATDQSSIGYVFGLDTENGVRKVNVERKFKRTETGLSTSFSRLQIMDEDENVLEVWDKTTDVTNQVVDLLGLTREDFMRSVVLPQGKFSEFLTLEGKERRDMLERLLNLKAYGSALQMKIKRRGDLVKNSLLQMEGEMKRYSDITPEALQAVKSEYKEILEEEKKLEALSKSLEKEKIQGEALYQIIENLKSVDKSLQELNEKSESMAREEKTIERAQEADKIWPYYENHLKNDITVKQLKEKIDQTEKEYDLSQKAYKLTKEKLDLFLNTYDERKDQLNLKKSHLENARDHKNKALVLTKERQELLTDYKRLQAQGKQETIKLENAQNQVAELEKKLADLEEEKASYQVDTKERETIMQGLKKEEAHKEITKQIENIDGDIKELAIKLKKAEEDFKQAEVVQNSCKDNLEKKRKEIESLSSALQTLPEKKSVLEAEKNQTNHEVASLIDKLSEKNKLTAKRQTLLNDKSSLDKKLKVLSNELKSAKNDLDEAEKERSVYWTEKVLTQMAKTLEEGDACPLCGSSSHPKCHVSSEVKDDFDWSGAEEKWRQVKLDYDRAVSDFDHLEKEISEVDTALEVYKTITLDGQRQKEDFLKKVSEEIDQIDKAIRENKTLYEKAVHEKKTLENQLELERSKVTKAHSLFTMVKTQLASKTDQVKGLKEDYDRLSQELDYDKNGYKYSALYEDLKNKDETLDKTDKAIKGVRQNHKDQNAALDSLKTDHHKTQLKIQSIIEKGSGLKDRIESHEAEVKKVVGDKDIEVIYKDTLDTLEKLINDHDLIKKEAQASEEKFRKLASTLESQRAQMGLSKENQAESQRVFLDALKTSDIPSEEVLKAAHMDKTELDQRRQKLKSYFEALSIQKDRKQSLEKQRDGRNLSEEAWKSILEKFEDTKKDLADKKEKRIQLGEKVKNLESEQKKLQETLKRYDKYEKVQDLIQDLMDLVRGNKFVEYVAVTHLKYIARDASKRLMDITGHRYSLELDTKGNFIICDHFNGGVKRDTKTLSGGETFLTALSLSLALSSQIQLKGRTNLEFFFLDEGFGTLDSELLDIVMTSLEKLYHEKLTVGIISHVDELKNRVPIKLTVEPAQAGVHGTKTKIEVT